MTDKTSNQMWGGRFAAGPDAIMEAINASIGFDKRMAAQDIAGSRAHSRAISGAANAMARTSKPSMKLIIIQISTALVWNEVIGFARISLINCMSNL